MTSGSLATELAALVGTEHVLHDAELTRRYSTDWTGRFVGSTPAVVRPANTEEVASVLAWCNERGIAVIPQGGNTGLAAGATPLDGEVVVSLERLAGVHDADPDGARITAGAGTTLATVRARAAELGWDYGVDLAARDSATMGGTVATNAGGIHVLRWGSTRRQVVGIEAVLADGNVLASLRGLDKDNTGYDLAGLLCGSEGTLGVVTAVQVRLVARLEQSAVALVGFTDSEAALAAAVHWRRALRGLLALEYLDAAVVDLVCSELGLALPTSTPAAAYLLAEVAGEDDPTAELAAVVLDTAGMGDAAVADDPARRRALWQLRERATEAIALRGPAHKLDVSLPTRTLAQFVAAVPEVVASLAPQAQVWLFGHAGDGNIHVNVTNPSTAPALDESIDGEIFALVARLGGSISAEHGIGRAKQDWLHLSRSPAERSAFAAIKYALDPVGILNPGVLVPALR